MEILKAQANSVQQFSALNAFKSNTSVKSKEEESQKEPLTELTSGGTQTLSAKTLLDKIDMEEIRKFAGYVGEFNITDEDIKYGLLYGRSVIAEYLC